MTDATKLIERLKEAAQAATPQNLDTAQQVERYEDGSHITCPTCGGEGYAELHADFCNYDGKAIGVQFYGIGPEHLAAEAYFRVASPAAILELIDLIEQQAAALEAANARIAELEAAAKAEPIYQTCFIQGQWRDVDRFEYDRAKGLRDDLARIVYTAPAAALAQPLEAQVEALAAIKSAIADYHFALDMRAHGGVAQDRAFNAICNTLGMHWKQGEETSRRALEAVKEPERDTRTIDMFSPEG